MVSKKVGSGKYCLGWSPEKKFQKCIEVCGHLEIALKIIKNNNKGIKLGQCGLINPKNLSLQNDTKQVFEIWMPLCLL